jgi:hypothetical protein
MIRTQVYIPEELYKEAQLYAGLYRKNISALMREGLEIAMQNLRTAQKTNPLGSLAGKFSAKGSGDKNAAFNHNDIYSI